MIKQVLVVCVGNICRSPVAELLLRDHLHREGKNIGVSSAGIKAVVGAGVDETMASFLPSYIDHESFRSRQINEEYISSADLVLVADSFVLHKVKEKWPEYAAKVFLLGHWSGAFEVPDPYRQSVQCAEQSYNLICSGITEWLKYL